MHRDAGHGRVAHFAGLVLRHIGDQPRGDDALAVQRALVQQRLIERGDAARGAVAAAARQAGGAHLAAVVARFARIAGDHHAAAVLRLRHADEDVVGDAERLGDALADHVTVVLAGDGLDHHALHEVRGAAVILQARARRPFQREVADFFPHQRVIGPRRFADVCRREAADVAHHLVQGDVGLAVRSEFGEVVRRPCP